MSVPKSLVHVEGLSYSYSGADGPVSVLREVNIQIEQGEFVAILGASGSGKSTLLNLLGGLEKPKQGQVWVGGHNLASLTDRKAELFRQTQVAFIFQFFNLLPTLSALENVLLGMEAMDDAPKDAARRANEVLAGVGLGSKLDRIPSQLSGGEQQRVAIARALAKRAPLILADEPTGNLDEETANSVMNLLVKMQRESNSALILITHDSSVAQRADRVVELVKGQLRATTTQQEARYAAHR